MRIKCAISNISYAIPSYAPVPDTIQGLHPLLTLPLPQLYKVAAQSEALSPQEFKLLWLALLVRNPFTLTREAISLDCLNLTICEQSLPLLLQASQAPASRLNRANMPMLSISPATITGTGLAAWLDLLEEALRYGAIISREAEAQSIEYLRASNAAAARSGKAFRLIATWAIDQMLIRCPGFSDNGLRTLTQILFDNRPSNLDYMQDLKGRLLDHLPEKSVDDAFRKRTVIERMDTCIADGLLVAQALGLKTQEYIAEQAQVIASTYTIDGIINSAASPAALLGALLTGTREAQSAGAVELRKPEYTPEQIAANPLLARLAARKAQPS